MASEYTRGYRAADHDRIVFGIEHVRAMAKMMAADVKGFFPFNIGYRTFATRFSVTHSLND